MVSHECVWSLVVSGACLVASGGVRQCLVHVWWCLWCLVHLWWCVVVSNACLVVSGWIISGACHVVSGDVSMVFEISGVSMVFEIQMTMVNDSIENQVQHKVRAFNSR